MLRMEARFFTPEEANALLPRVVPLVERMVERAGELASAEAARAQLLARIATNGGDLAPSDLAEATQAAERAETRLAESVEAVQELGAQVKDARAGLLDFPARRRGEVVLLCWRFGEDQISFWHPVDEGFAGRRPLPL
jgi:hypothetical protein